MLERLRKSRAEIEAWLSARRLDSLLSTPRFLLHRKLRKAIARHVSGDVLEAGSGRSPLAKHLQEVSTSVTRIDIDGSRGPLDIVADIQQMPEIATESFDAVICTQVLEHVSDPFAAVDELERVLLSGGVLILSVPHLSMIHEAPSDFFRFTSFGISAMVRGAFEELELEASAGLVAFLSHPLSLALWSLAGAVPFLRWPIFLLNSGLVGLSALLDKGLGFRSLFPVDHVLVAIKRRVT